MLAKAILGALTSGVLGVLFWKVVEEWKTNFPKFAALGTLATRGVVWAMCILAVAALFAFSVGMQFVPLPANALGWLGPIGDYSFIAITMSQGLHAVAADKAKKALLASVEQPEM